MHLHWVTFYRSCEALRNKERTSPYLCLPFGGSLEISYEKRVMTCSDFIGLNFDKRFIMDGFDCPCREKLKRMCDFTWTTSCSGSVVSLGFEWGRGVTRVDKVVDVG